MRSVPQSILDSIGGSVPDARLVVNAWYGGRVVGPDLPVDKWSISWDGSESAVVQGKLSLTVADRDGSLSPWGWDEALSAGGSRLQVQYTAGGEAVDLGRFLITSNAPNEVWRVAGPRLQWVHGGSSLPVSGEELTRLAADDKFWAPETPPGTGMIAEVTRLLSEWCPVVIAPGVTDKTVPGGLVYEKTRGDHAHDLVRSFGYYHRMTGGGAFEVYSQAKGAPVWTIAGRAEGALVSVARSQSRDDVVNGVASQSNDTALEIRKLATLESGPLRYGGEFGKRIVEHTALVNTPEGVQKDADSYLATRTMSSTLKLAVVCLPHPGVQIGDWVRVAHPVIDGSEYPLDGLVTSVDMSGSAAGFDDMKLTVEVSMEDAQKVGLYVREASQ